MWKCDRCEHEYSACMGDSDVPAICECGGKIRENHSMVVDIDGYEDEQEPTS